MVRSKEARTLLHWKILILSFLCLVVLVFLFSFFLYQTVITGERSLSEGAISNNSRATASELLNTTVGFFKKKSVTFDRERRASGFSPDPSR